MSKKNKKVTSAGKGGPGNSNGISQKKNLAMENLKPSNKYSQNSAR